jgi:hypothetical protein
MIGLLLHNLNITVEDVKLTYVIFQGFNYIRPHF